MKQVLTFFLRGETTSRYNEVHGNASEEIRAAEKVGLLMKIRGSTKGTVYKTTEDGRKLIER